MRNLTSSLLLLFSVGLASAAIDPDYVIVAAEHQNIENNPKYLDLRPDDITRHFYIWENTALGETLNDTPFEGAEYTRLKINSGWFGIGFISDEPVDFSFFAKKEMVLHFAIRTTSTAPLFVKLESGGYPGSAKVDLKGIYDVPRDGEWHTVEIPVSAFQAAGLSWAGNVGNKNYFTLISEQAQSGSVIDLDYIYFHNGTRDDGTKWTGLNLGEVSDSNPKSFLIASEHTGIEGNPEYVDLRPDDVTKHLYVWDNTAEDYQNYDLEPFEGSQFSCLHITGKTWFGFGITSDTDTDFSAYYKQPYYLRFAVATTSLMPLFVKLEGNDNSSATVYLQGKYNFRRDGKWHVIQIPITDFLYQGVDLRQPVKGKNYFSLVSEKAIPDYLLSFDAITVEAGVPTPVNDPRPEVDKSKLADYVLIATEEGVVPEGKNVLDIRPNGSSINLYVWENTAIENPTTEGDAFEGSQYSSLKVQSSWFGFGILNSAPADFTCFQYKNFNFHMAMRTTSTMPIQLRFEGVGTAQYDLTEKNLPRDGKWHVVEFPAADLFSQGLVWDGEQQGVNYFSLVSEKAESGAVIDFDAIYFYSTGNIDNPDGGIADNGIKDSSLKFFGNALYASDTTTVSVYDTQGRNVFTGKTDRIDTSAWHKGMYIAVQDGATLKFIVK